jgi:poly-gamma-glutamate capsule biosynthesis protein CapA/YwtB (metallophosphatase superfamily)
MFVLRKIMKKYWKIIISILVALVFLSGFWYRKNLAGFVMGENTQSINFSDGSLESYYEKGQSLRGPQGTEASATFLSVGDIMLSRNVAATVQKSGDVNLPFLKMADILKSTDFNFGNLETPVAEKNPTIGGHSLVFSSPQDYVRPLKTYNFQILNLANNHALDKGLAGLNFTNSFLDGLGIKHVGVGNNLDGAWQPQTVEANGIKICFIGASYSSINDNGKTTNEYLARIEDLDNLKSAIRNSQSLCNFVVATMHAGTEYVRKPNDAQIKFAHAAIDFGADVVIGAHPHWVQTIEKYNNKYIFYSLGNFIFDQEWSQDTKEGLTLKIQVSKNKTPELQGSRERAKLESVELIPVIIENYSTPRPATEDESAKILQKIGQKENILLP